MLIPPFPLVVTGASSQLRLIRHVWKQKEQDFYKEWSPTHRLRLTVSFSSSAVVLYELMISFPCLCFMMSTNGKFVNFLFLKKSMWLSSCFALWKQRVYSTYALLLACSWCKKLHFVLENQVGMYNSIGNICLPNHFLL